MLIFLNVSVDYLLYYIFNFTVAKSVTYVVSNLRDVRKSKTLSSQN